MAEPAAPLVTLERRDDGVAVITLANPKVNALSTGVLRQLHEIVQDLMTDLPGAVVITGGPRLFAAGVEPFFSASTYDCTILIGLAAIAARSDAPDKIAASFARNLTGKVDCSTFADCAKALAQRRTIHYRGASSRFDHWQKFEPGSGMFDVWFVGPEGRPALLPPSAQIAVDPTAR